MPLRWHRHSSVSSVGRNKLLVLVLVLVLVLILLLLLSLVLVLVMTKKHAQKQRPASAPPTMSVACRVWLSEQQPHHRATKRSRLCLTSSMTLGNQMMTPDRRTVANTIYRGAMRAFTFRASSHPLDFWDS